MQRTDYLKSEIEQLKISKSLLEYDLRQNIIVFDKQKQLELQEGINTISETITKYSMRIQPIAPNPINETTDE
ncbi:hypothetical protein [uncultured Flavobacterium sp.]|uniref:hypothetical protein n=1 Tax=uncultured Flavobacterium sp. TaxID=165435 RepID=UPI00259228B5|nr:hypothetical protein [uncultured Flavobacterium sp.]